MFENGVVDIHDSANRNQVRLIYGTWLANGMFIEMEAPDERRRMKRFVKVGEWAT